jgi:hypothetical protein
MGGCVFVDLRPKSRSWAGAEQDNCGELAMPVMLGTYG